MDMLIIQAPGKEKEKNGCNKIALQTMNPWRSELFVFLSCEHEVK
jgi:hypothetical protein